MARTVHPDARNVQDCGRCREAGLIEFLTKFIPGRQYLIGATVAALTTAFVAYTLHERSAGAQAIRISQAKAAAAQAALAAEKTTHGTQKATQAEQTYDTTVRTAPPDPPHFIVRDCPATRTVSVPNGSEVSLPEIDDSNGPEKSVDIGPAIDTIGRDADAKIEYLQELLKSCIKIGACKETP